MSAGKKREGQPDGCLHRSELAGSFERCRGRVRHSLRRRHQTLAASPVVDRGDVQNVTDRRNPEEIVYSYNYAQRRTITGLPILPVVGAKLSW